MKYPLSFILCFTFFLTSNAQEGNISGYSTTIKLPKSKIRVDIPIVHFRINADRNVPSRGVMPDYEVPQSWEGYITEENSKLKFALELISSN